MNTNGRRTYVVYLCELFARYEGTTDSGIRLDRRVTFNSLTFTKGLSMFGSGSVSIDSLPYIPRPYESGVFVGYQVEGKPELVPVFLGIIQDVEITGMDSAKVGFVELAAWLSLTVTPRDLRFDQVLEVDILQGLIDSVGYRNPGVSTARNDVMLVDEKRRDRTYDAGQNLGDAFLNMSRVIEGLNFRTTEELEHYDGFSLARTKLLYRFDHLHWVNQLVTERIADFSISLSGSSNINRAVSTVSQQEPNPAYVPGGDEPEFIETLFVINRTSYRDTQAIDFSKSWAAGIDLSVEAVTDDLDATLTRERLGAVTLGISSRNSFLVDAHPGWEIDIRTKTPYPLKVTAALVETVQTTIDPGGAKVDIGVILPRETDIG